MRDGADLVVDGYEFAPTFSIWTTIEECLNPPIVYERARGLLHDRAVLRARGVRVPRGDRSARVRERRARRGAADPAVDRLQPRHVQVRARRRSSSTCCATLHRVGLDGTEPVDVGDVEVSPRDVVAACLPDPARLGDRMHGKTCAGTYVTGTGTDGRPRAVYLYHVVDNADSMARRRLPGGGVADRASTPSSRSSCSAPERGRAPACSGRRRSTRSRSSSCWPSTAPRTPSRSASRRRVISHRRLRAAAGEGARGGCSRDARATGRRGE